MIIDALATLLEDNSLGTVGTDIFVGELPLDDNNVISLIVSPSPEPDKAIPYYMQAIDIWARYSIFDTGYGKLQSIMDVIHQQENYEMHGYHVYLSYARGMIEDLDRDSERRHLFKLSLAFVYRISEESS
jgi:hypothetical protein